MTRSDVATSACCNLITYILLMVFAAVAVGTFHWGVAMYEIEAGVGCSADVDWFIGLYKQYQSVDSSCFEDSSDTSDFDCDNLSDESCDFLKEARNEAAVVVTCIVVLLLLYSTLMCVVKRPSRLIYFLVAVSIVVTVVMVANAFSATVAYDGIIENFNDISGEFDMTPGFSYQLMLAVGVIGIPSIGVSLATAYFYYYSKDVSDNSLNVNLVEGTPGQYPTVVQKAEDM